MVNDPPLAQRLAEARRLADEHSELFESMLSKLLSGGEKVIGFSAWRTNADLVLELSRRAKELRPDVLVVIGGPEATASFDDFKREWIDVVIESGGEGAIAPVFRALVDGEPSAAAAYEHVWLNPRHGARVHLLRRKPAVPPLPRIDYAEIVPLFLDDPSPTIPMLMNMGCPFRCSFCTNTTIYPTLEWGTPARVLEEMQQVSTLWSEAFETGKAPLLRLTFCDAAINAWPDQFENLCTLLAAAEWPAPYVADGHIVLSSRITPHRVALALDAGFESFFFGLETASPKIRAFVKKPGSIEAVARSLEVLRDTRDGALTVSVGVIVGFPGEEEEDFDQTLRFLDWAVGLGVVRELSVNPLVRNRASMDLGALVDSEGPAFGVHWRLPGAAGTPNERIRRVFQIMEHFDGVVDVSMGS